MTNTTAGSVSCTLYALGLDGSVYYSIANATSAAGVGRVTLNFHPTERLDGIYYASRCSLPSKQTGQLPSRITT